MEVRQLVKVLLRRWWLVALPILVVAVYLGATASPPATTYQTVMRFAAGTEPAGLSIDYDRYYPWLTSEYIANALADLAVTQAFAQAVTGRLSEQNLDVDAGMLQAGLASDNAQSIFVIYLYWPDAAQSVTIAEAISAELTENGAAYFPQLGGLDLPARRLDAPRPAPMAPSLRARLLGPGIKLALAVAAGLGLALLNYYLDPFIREQEDLKALDIPIAGAIPRVAGAPRRKLIA